MVVMFTIIFASVSQSGPALIGAFLLGIFLDLWDGGALGYSSLFFLLVSFAIQLYKRKFNAHTPFFLIVAGIIVLYSYSLYRQKAFIPMNSVLQLFLLSFSVVVVWVIINRIWDRKFGEKNLSV